MDGPETGAPDASDVPAAAMSVVVPVHDEAAILDGFLRRLTAGAEPGELDVVVACNGCTDGSADVARAFGPPVRVVELAEAGKIGALNAGDDASRAFPRLYLDADIDVGIDDLRAVADVLRADEPLIAAPRLHVDVSGSGPLVRAYYDVWTRLPWATENLVGSGFYGVSAKARARFDRFPDVIGDDMWLSALFSGDERRSVAGATFTIRPPRTVAQLVRRRARIMLGNEEVRALLPARPEAARHAGAAPTLLRRDWRLLPQVTVYLALSVVAELEARRRRKRGDRRWSGESRA
jgi:glycosyltransferase involved in cell wall biosynthesis